MQDWEQIILAGRRTSAKVLRQDGLKEWKGSQCGWSTVTERREVSDEVQEISRALEGSTMTFEENKTQRGDLTCPKKVMKIVSEW